MSDFLPHPFWNFSLELYAGEGVAEACLDLQERRGCDVNILLFCCWLGASGRPTLTADRLRTILKASDAWQAEIVRPLRAVRRLLKDRPWPEALPETVDAVRRRVADAELAAEHAEQIKLASLHSPPADRDRPIEKRLRAAVGNLGVYAVCLGVVPDAKDRAAVVALMKGTFPALRAERSCAWLGSCCEIVDARQVASANRRTAPLHPGLVRQGDFRRPRHHQMAFHRNFSQGLQQAHP